MDVRIWNCKEGEIRGNRVKSVHPSTQFLFF
ncbi:MAG: hypothetical protein RL329_2688 [Bacteroidota bacterium]